MRKVQGVTSTLMRCFFLQFAIPGSYLGVCDAEVGLRSQLPDWEPACAWEVRCCCWLQAGGLVPSCTDGRAACFMATPGAHAELLPVTCWLCPLFGSTFPFPFPTCFFPCLCYAFTLCSLVASRIPELFYCKIYHQFETSAGIQNLELLCTVFWTSLFCCR